MEEHLVLLVDPWQDKYERLLEAHEKLQKLNQCLEEKLLKLAEERQAESTQLSNQIQDLTQRLVEARVCIHQLEDENERYRNDINVAVQLLQCKPSNFISQKIDTLPEDLQRKVLGQKNGMGSGRKEKKIIKVQVPTLPPTDIMYAVDKTNKGGKQQRNGEKDIVSAAIMAKVLEERENERKENQKNRCHCASRIILPTVQKETQTMPSCTISYSDFPFVDDSSTTMAATTTTTTTTTMMAGTRASSSTHIGNNNSHHNNNDDEGGSKYEDYTEYRYNGPRGGRETSFSSHQSSSSLSSPTSSTTSDSAHPHSHLHHHHHHHHLQHHLPHHPAHGLLNGNHHLHSTSQPSSARLNSMGNMSSSSSSSQHSENESGGRKLPGHCVRQVLDEKEGDEMLEDRGDDGGRSSGVVNWRTTVLVQHPPKNHGGNHDSLSLLMTSSSKATPPSSLPLMPYSVSTTPSSLSSSQNSPPQPVDHLLDSEDSSLGLGSCSSSSSISSQLPTALVPQLAHHAPHNPHNTTSVTTVSISTPSVRAGQVNGLNNYHGNPLSNPISAYPSLASTQQSHQYYRAQKRTFWTRSSSTTSTETEI